MTLIKKISNFLGFYSEYIVIIRLLNKNFFIKRWRYKNKLGEIDIIAINIKEKSILFGEVKYRSNSKYLIESLSQKQIDRIYQSAEFFLYENEKYKNYSINFSLFLISDEILEIPMF